MIRARKKTNDPPQPSASTNADAPVMSLDAKPTPSDLPKLPPKPSEIPVARAPVAASTSSSSPSTATVTASARKPATAAAKSTRPLASSSAAKPPAGAPRSSSLAAPSSRATQPSAAASQTGANQNAKIQSVGVSIQAPAVRPQQATISPGQPSKPGTSTGAKKAVPPPVAFEIDISSPAAAIPQETAAAATSGEALAAIPKTAASTKKPTAAGKKPASKVETAPVVAPEPTPAPPPPAVPVIVQPSPNATEAAAARPGTSETTKSGKSGKGMFFRSRNVSTEPPKQPVKEETAPAATSAQLQAAAEPAVATENPPVLGTPASDFPMSAKAQKPKSMPTTPKSTGKKSNIKPEPVATNTAVSAVSNTVIEEEDPSQVAGPSGLNSQSSAGAGAVSPPQSPKAVRPKTAIKPKDLKGKGKAPITSINEDEIEEPAPPPSNTPATTGNQSPEIKQSQHVAAEGTKVDKKPATALGKPPARSTKTPAGNLKPSEKQKAKVEDGNVEPEKLRESPESPLAEKPVAGDSPTQSIKPLEEEKEGSEEKLENSEQSLGSSEAKSDLEGKAQQSVEKRGRTPNKNDGSPTKFSAPIKSSMRSKSVAPSDELGGIRARKGQSLPPKVRIQEPESRQRNSSATRSRRGSADSGTETRTRKTSSTPDRKKELKKPLPPLKADSKVASIDEIAEESSKSYSASAQGSLDDSSASPAEGDDARASSESVNSQIQEGRSKSESSSKDGIEKSSSRNKEDTVRVSRKKLVEADSNESKTNDSANRPRQSSIGGKPRSGAATPTNRAKTPAAGTKFKQSQEELSPSTNNPNSAAARDSSIRPITAALPRVKSPVAQLETEQPSPRESLTSKTPQPSRSRMSQSVPASEHRRPMETGRRRYPTGLEYLPAAPPGFEWIEVDSLGRPKMRANMHKTDWEPIPRSDLDWYNRILHGDDYYDYPLQRRRDYDWTAPQARGGGHHPGPRGRSPPLRQPPPPEITPDGHTSKLAMSRKDMAEAFYAMGLPSPPATAKKSNSNIQWGVDALPPHKPEPPPPGVAPSRAKQHSNKRRNHHAAQHEQPPHQQHHRNNNANHTKKNWHDAEDEDYYAEPVTVWYGDNKYPDDYDYYSRRPEFEQGNIPFYPPVREAMYYEDDYIDDYTPQYQYERPYSIVPERRQPTRLDYEPPLPLPQPTVRSDYPQVYKPPPMEPNESSESLEKVAPAEPAAVEQETPNAVVEEAPVGSTNNLAVEPPVTANPADISKKKYLSQYVQRASKTGEKVPGLGSLTNIMAKAEARKNATTKPGKLPLKQEAKEGVIKRGVIQNAASKLASRPEWQSSTAKITGGDKKSKKPPATKTKRPAPVDVYERYTDRIRAREEAEIGELEEAVHRRRYDMEEDEEEEEDDTPQRYNRRGMSKYQTYDEEGLPSRIPRTGQTTRDPGGDGMRRKIIELDETGQEEPEPSKAKRTEDIGISAVPPPQQPNATLNPYLQQYPFSPYASFFPPSNPWQYQMDPYNPWSMSQLPLPPPVPAGPPAQALPTYGMDQTTTNLASLQPSINVYPSMYPSTSPAATSYPPNPYIFNNPYMPFNPYFNPQLNFHAVDMSRRALLPPDAMMMGSQQPSSLTLPPLPSGPIVGYSNNNGTPPSVLPAKVKLATIPVTVMRQALVVEAPGDIPGTVRYLDVSGSGLDLSSLGGSVTNLQQSKDNEDAKASSKTTTTTKTSGARSVLKGRGAGMTGTKPGATRQRGK